MDVLNLASLCLKTSSLGIGTRFAIWVQGCPFNCKGCIAPDWIPFKKNLVLPISYVAQIAIDQENIQGITISGGEPMLQAGRLAKFLALVFEKRPELDVIIFSGFTLKQLNWDEAKRLLAYTDLLVDGQYVDQKNNGMGLRGSSNQQFHFLTDRLLPYRSEIENQRQKLEFHISDEGVLMTGIPDKNFKW